MSWWTTNDKYEGIIAHGSIRAGKTLALSVGFIAWAMSNFTDCNFAICGKTVTSCRKNVIDPLMRALTGVYKMQYKNTASCLTIGTNRFYVYGGKDESSQALIQGITLAGILLDEVALMPESFVNQATGRCSVDGSKFWFNCNPESPNHWFYTGWVQHARKRRLLLLHFTMDDNPSLSEKVKQRYEEQYDGVFYDRFIRGLWVRAEGIIYRSFADDPKRYFIEKPPPLMQVNIGMDFGGTHSMHSLVATGITPGYKKLIALGSERLPAVDKTGKKGTTPEDVERFAVQFVGRVIKKYGRCDYLYYDSAEQVLGRGVKKAVGKAYPSVKVRECYKAEINDRISLMTRLLGLGMFGYTGDCETLKSALCDAVWDEKKVDTRLDDGSTDVDTLDALEYSFTRNMDRFIF